MSMKSQHLQTVEVQQKAKTYMNDNLEVTP